MRSHTPSRRSILTPKLIAVLAALAVCLPAGAQPATPAIADGAAFLAARQQADGSWTSAEARTVHATAEALRGLQAAGAEPGARSAAVSFLSAAPALDHDDRARRLPALAASGTPAPELADALAGGAEPLGGWGLASRFAAEPLTTALALQALAGGVGDPGTVEAGLARLLALQGDDGGWPCGLTSDPDAAGDVYCTGRALLALVAHRSSFDLEEEIGRGADALRAHLQPDGGFGPAGDGRIARTAVASVALAAVPALGGEVASVIAFLEGEQGADGSWRGDPLATGLAVRALSVLAGVPFCGDGAINQPGEACDGLELAGASCPSLGFGTGTLACGTACSYDTSGCAVAPECGDGLRNQPFEICDGADTGGVSCADLGFAAGTLGCAADCTGLDPTTCTPEPTCGDGVINQPSEICDLSDLGGASCESLGLGGGLLGCDAGCGFDVSQCNAASAEVDNAGREFLVAFLRPLTERAKAELHLTARVATEVTVQYPVDAPTFLETVAVAPGEITVVELPAEVFSGWTAGEVRSNAVRLSAPEEVVAYLVNREPASSDAAMALPVEALGTRYVATTTIADPSVDRAQLVVVAAFDDTTVTITPTAHLVPGFPAGTPLEVELDRGEGFRAETLTQATDLTGTIVESDRPVAVLNGNVCSDVPFFVRACDHVFEFAHPVSSWGTSALVAEPTILFDGSELRFLGLPVYRVVAAEDGTEVRLDGELQTVLDRGGLLEELFLDGHHRFEGSKPIFVTQWLPGNQSPESLFGDPAMLNVIPPEQFLDGYTFSTVGGSQFTIHGLTVVVPDEAVGEVLLDGEPIDPEIFSPIPDSGYSAASLLLDEGSHTTASPLPHGISVWGANSFDSYMYPGGARIELINPFCGDGEVNLAFEQCDLRDFDGRSCTDFGFESGTLGCDASCAVDTSGCSGLAVVDEDGDGFSPPEDCADDDPAVHPGVTELPGNGVDDDCNQATPDQVPPGAVSCQLTSDRASYTAVQTIQLTGVLDTGGLGDAEPPLTLVGLEAVVTVRDAGGAEAFTERRALAPLPPGALLQQAFALAAGGRLPGAYHAELAVESAGQAVAICGADFTLSSSAQDGAGLTGTLAFVPSRVDAGETAVADFTAANRGNAAFPTLGLRILLVDADTGAVVAERLETTSLFAGEELTAAAVFDTAGLPPRAYLGILTAILESGDEIHLAEAGLEVVNAPPDCSTAVAAPDSLWPPNHRAEEVAVQGVSDPDGDPVTVTVLSVHQDEPTDGTGDGNTCPDATGVGGSTVQILRERSGQGDGRVYHLRVLAEDGRGASCQATVTVCVPHDAGGGCVDQGPLFDATVCD